MTNTSIDVEKKEAMELFGLVSAGSGLSELNLSVRSFNCLVKAGIVEVDELVFKSKEELSTIQGMNERTLEEIQQKVELFVKNHPEYLSFDYDDWDDWD